MSSGWVVAYVALAVTVVCEGAVLIGLLRRVGPTLEGLEAELAGRQMSPLDSGLRVGEPVPQFAVADQHGQSVSSVELWSGGEALVLLTEARCVACERLLAALRKEPWRASDRQLFVIGDEIGGDPLPGERLVWLEQSDGSATRAFRSFVSPQAFLISATGKVLARSVPQSVADLRALGRHDAEDRTDVNHFPEVQIHGHYPVE